MKIYCISLDEDHSRRDFLYSQFVEENVNFIFISAVKGNFLAAKKYFQYMHNHFRIYNRILSPSEIGCTLSHIKALEEFIDSGERYALILEDDVIGKDKDIENIRIILKFLDFKGILMCGGQEGLPVDWQDYRYGRSSKIDTELFLVNPYSIRFFSRTVCYVVDRTFALHYIQSNKKVIHLADDWGGYFHNTTFSFYFKNILSHPEDLINSHIESQRKLTQNFLTNKSIFESNFWFKCYRKLINLFFLIFSIFKKYDKIK